MITLGLGRFLFPCISFVLGIALLFLTFVLVPLSCPSNLLSGNVLLSRPGLVAMNGFILDLSRATYPPTVALRDQFQGLDISPLVPRILWLGRGSNATVGSQQQYSDTDINSCVLDPLVADAWLKQTLRATVNTLYTLNEFGVPEKCPAPRPLTATLADTRLNANSLALSTDTRLKPPGSFADAWVDNPHLSDLKSASMPPDLSYPCVTDPNIIRDLYGSAIAHVEVTPEAIGLVAKGSPSLLSPATVELRSPTTIWGGMVWVENHLFDVAQYLRVATSNSVAIAPNSLDLGSTVVREGDTMFLPRPLTEFLMDRAGYPNDGALGLPLSMSLSDRKLFHRCLIKLFYVGKRPVSGFKSQFFSLNCWSQNPLILAFAVITAFALLIQSLAATLLSFSSLSDSSRDFLDPAPSTRSGHTVFLLSMLAEPAAVVKKSILSVANARCPNKLVIIVCDGNVRASGEVKDTWQVVLDTLQYYSSHSAQKCSFADTPHLYRSLGHDRKQTNLARMYSGVYTKSTTGPVSWVLIAKIGNPWERQLALPGNRGKCDSIHLFAHYLRSVMTSSSAQLSSVLSPLEFALHQSLLALNVDSTLLKYLLTVDGDTIVDPYAPRLLVDTLDRNDSVAAAFGSLGPVDPYASLGSMIASADLYWHTHVRPSIRGISPVLPPINTAFVAYRLRDAALLKPATMVYPNQSAVSSSLSLDSSLTVNAEECVKLSLDEKAAVLTHYNSNRGLVFLHSFVLRRLAMSSMLSAFEQNLYLLGQDAHMGTTLQLAQPDCSIKYVPSARAFSHVPTSISLVTRWLIRQWIARVFVQIDQLYAPRHVPTPSTSRLVRLNRFIIYWLDRTWVIASIVKDLTLPWIFVALTLILVLGSVQPWSYFGLAAAICLAAFGSQIVLLAFVRQRNLIPVMFVAMTFCLPLTWAFVPLFGLMTVTAVRWVDQWPADGTKATRRPGALIDST